MNDTLRYGMFGMTRAAVLQHGPVDLWPDEARAILMALTSEQIDHRPVTAWVLTRPSTHLWIQYDEHWWEVTREDLCQHVRTGRFGWTVEAACDAIVYGVRLDRARSQFCIIDCTTDG